VLSTQSPKWNLKA